MSQQPVFADRHVGPRPDDIARMLERVGFDSLDHLMAAAVPAGIASRTLDLPEPLSEHDAARELRRLADLNHRRSRRVASRRCSTSRRSSAT